jgi:hypothetical protein
VDGLVDRFIPSRAMNSTHSWRSLRAQTNSLFLTILMRSWFRAA